MAIEVLRRTTYRDPTSSGNPVRTGSVACSEDAVDMDQYYRPLEHIHGSNLHGWGIASGLRVTATLNNAGVTILPGVAVDLSGRHISLANGGSAEVGANADTQGTPPNLAPVSATGLTLATTGLSGDKYLTIQFRETFDFSANQTSGVFQFLHTPWLRLVDVPSDPAGFPNDGSSVVLAHVKLDTGANTGNVLALSHDLRRNVETTVQVLHVRNQQQAAAPNLAVDDGEAGRVQSRPAGGLTVVADVVGLQTLAGQEVFTIDSVGGNLGRSNGPATLHLWGSQVADTGNNLVLSSPTKVSVAAAYFRVGAGFADQMDTGQNHVQMDVVDRVRFRQGGTSSAGVWLYQTIPNRDQAFVGMASDTRVGFWGNHGTGNQSGVGWGFWMDTGTGLVNIVRSAFVGANLNVNGLATCGSLNITFGATIGGGVSMASATTHYGSVLNRANREVLQLTNTSNGNGDGYLGVHIASGTEVLRVTTSTAGSGFISLSQSNGTVGMNTSAGSGGGWLNINRGNGSVAVAISTVANAAQGGFLETRGPSGKSLVQLSTLNPGGEGSIEVFGSDGNAKLWMQGNGNKNFIMVHPQDSSKEIMYSCLEGPEVAAYCRGRARLTGGRVSVNLPDHFVLVVNPDTLTVQLTPRSAESKGLAVVEQSPQGFVVQELSGGAGSYDFDYFVAGVRRSHEHFVPVVPKGHYAVPEPGAAPAAAGAPGGVRFVPRTSSRPDPEIAPAQTSAPAPQMTQ